MIVDPDFLDHWKTRMLVGNLADESAPLYVLRLWAHCQNRRQSVFDNLTTEALKALCRFPGAANKLESSLTASGFIRRDGESLEVCNWDEYNSSLIAAWENGKRGGRPKKPKGNPGVNPAVTHGVTDKRGLDKSREDNSLSLADEPKKIDHMEDLEFQKVWVQWQTHLLQLNKTPTNASLESQLYRLCDFDLAEAIAVVRFSIDRGAKNLIFDRESSRLSFSKRKTPGMEGII